MTKTIETRCFTVQYTDGVLIMTVKDNAEIELEDMVEFSDAAYAVVGSDVPVPVLTNLGRIKSASAEARRFSAEAPEMVAIATRCAMLVKHRVAQVIGNVFVGLNQPPYPTRLFTSEQAALAWLRSAAA